jgi:16S rRNA A1518/A1519 N6-dimethyltransferase RsmA/KsgA/DIM1 with predicted DNA glycosylase/AP lyase activity
MPEVLSAVISLSAENRPMAMRMDIKREIGIVNSMKEGKRKKISLAIAKTLMPLLITKSMICNIFPMSRTKVRINKMMIKEEAISLNIYRLMILRI